MRMVQYLEAKAAYSHPSGSDPVDRRSQSLYELAHGMYCWRRQVHVHHGLNAASQPGALPRGGSPAAASAPPFVGSQALCQKFLLESPRCRGLVRTSDARTWVKNKLHGRGVTDIAAAIRSVVQALAEIGVVHIHRKIQKASVDGTNTPGECPDHGGDQTGTADGVVARPRRGGLRHPVWEFEKCSWPDIERNEAAMQVLRDLGVSADHFLG